MKNKIKCDVCDKEFSNKYTLKNHQLTAKYCLRLRNKDISKNFNCVGCLKNFTTKHRLNTHSEKCIQLIKKIHKEEIKNLKNEYENKITDLQDRIERIAKRPTTNTTNNTNILNLTPFDMEDSVIKDKINEHYNLEYLKRGQRGVAEFTKDNILLDDEGKLKYICCDPSRMIFKYKDKGGEIRRDVKANNLSKKITPNILEKANVIITNEVNNIDKNADLLQVMDDYKGMFDDIQKMRSKPGILGSELSQLTT